MEEVLHEIATSYDERRPWCPTKMASKRDANYIDIIKRDGEKREKT